jgi:hypothetical protein
MVMAEEVNTTMKREKSSGLEPIVDGVARQPEVKKLLAGDDTALSAR